MLGCADIKNDAVNTVATIQGAATKIISNDETYEEKYGKKIQIQKSLNFV